MTEHPGFGTMPARLLDHRELGAQQLADRAGLDADEVRSVLSGRGPDAEPLRRLAPAPGFHAVDLFALAGAAVPEDMAPLDAAAAPWVKNTVTDTARLPAAERRALLRLIRSLPQEERRSGFAPNPPLPLAAGHGASVIRMLQYRNLSWVGMAHALASVTPTYLSAATYGVIGAGRTELTPRLVADIAALLGIGARDLAALTGVVLHEAPPPPAPEATDIAAILWEARRLSAEQAQHVSELARSLRKGCCDRHLADRPGP